MARETQLDTHEIDKLLADDDFIDDFDFSEDFSDQFVDLEDHLDEGSEDDSEGESEPATESSSTKGDSGGAGVVAAEDVTASVALEFDSFEFASAGAGKITSQGLKIAVGLALIFWLVQLFSVLFLLKQPVIIRDEIRPLTAETDLSRPSQPSAVPAAGSVEEMAVAVNPLEPEIFTFTLYLPLYSLDGLKVFSAEIEVIQFQESGRLVAAGQRKLQESLRLLLQESMGGRLREEIVDVKTHMTSMINPHVENFFIERKIDLDNVKIRIHNPNVQ